MSEQSFWRYHTDSGMIDSMPSEAMAVFYASTDNSMIIFAGEMFPEEEYPRINGDTIIIGPRCTTDADLLLITYKGQHYRKTCDKVVKNYDPNGGVSRCYLPIGHRLNLHTDKQGNVRYA